VLGFKFLQFCRAFIDSGEVVAGIVGSADIACSLV